MSWAVLDCAGLGRPGQAGWTAGAEEALGQAGGWRARLQLALMHPPFPSLGSCACACCCRQYEQDSHDQLVKTIEGQDLLPQVRGRTDGVPDADFWLLAAASWAGRPGSRNPSMHAARQAASSTNAGGAGGASACCRRCSRCC